MNSFNKIFKQIIIENNLQFPGEFPEKFIFADQGLEFIFDIMPTFNSNYVWHTLADLQNIPQLKTTLQNTDKSIRLEIADSFNQIANRKEQEVQGTQQQSDYVDMINNYHQIANWIYSLQDNQTQITMQEQNDINIHDTQCFNTVPNVVKEVRPRAYRRGLKALSLANRRKFNQAHVTEFQVPDETEITDGINKTDKLNKVKEPKLLQQPLTKNTVLPAPGVERPLGLNRTDKVKQNFSNLVYHPSITQITKETAKKRCIAQRKGLYNENAEDELEFTATNYSKPVQPVIPEKPQITEPQPLKKQLCIVCKEYITPKETILNNGKKIHECPKCGLRITETNY